MANINKANNKYPQLYNPKNHSNHLQTRTLPLAPAPIPDLLNCSPGVKMAPRLQTLGMRTGKTIHAGPRAAQLRYRPSRRQQRREGWSGMCVREGRYNAENERRTKEFYWGSVTAMKAAEGGD